MTKNLISVKQLRQDELSGYAIAVTSGFIVTYVSGVSGGLVSYVNSISGILHSQMTGQSGALSLADANLQAQLTALSGQLALSGAQGFRLPIASGVDTIHCLYGATHANQIAVTSIGTSGSTDPFLIPMIISTSPTGDVIGLSTPTPSANYYLNLMIPV